ncbi:MAG TPA: MFS transporter [Dehalococcoidales bacterium]
MIKKIFPILALAMFSSNLGMGIVAPLLPIYAQGKGADGIWIGLVVSSYAIANIVSTPLFGRLSDRKGRKVFLTLGLLFYSLISLSYIFAGSVPVLAMVRLLHGAAGGMVLPIASACIGDVAPSGQEGKWMGYSTAAFYGGFGAGPLIGGVMSQYLGMTATFSFMAGLNFLAFLIVLFFLPNTAPKPAHGLAAPRPAFKTILKSETVRGLFSYQIAAAIGQGSFTAFIPILASARGMSLTLIGILIAATMSLMSLMGPVAGVVADRFNKRILIVVGSLVIISALALVPSSGSFWQILLLAVTMALGAGMAMPSVSALSVTEGRKFGMGSTMGLISMGMSVGFAVGPVAAGEIVDFTSASFAFYFGSSAVALGLVPFLWYTRRNSQPVGKLDIIKNENDGI